MSPELRFEQSLYIGNAVSAIFFGKYIVIIWLGDLSINRFGVYVLGIALALCIHICLLLLKPENRRPRNYFYASYCIVLMIFFSIAMSSNFIFGQFMWIDHRDVPGGPPAYLATHITDWYNTFGTAASVALVFTADSLMVSMLYSVWLFHADLWLAITSCTDAISYSDHNFCRLCCLDWCCLLPPVFSLPYSRSKLLIFPT